MLFPGQFSNNRRPPRHNFLIPNRQFNQQSFNSPPFTAQSQNTLSSIASKGVGGLSKTLDNVQQVLRVIESASPIIQQYGPMIKNLPAMYRMMKAFKDINLEETEEELESGYQVDPSIDFDEFNEFDEVEDSPNENLLQENDHKDIKPTRRSGESVPKLFI